MAPSIRKRLHPRNWYLRVCGSRFLVPGSGSRFGFRVPVPGSERANRERGTRTLNQNPEPGTRNLEPPAEPGTLSGRRGSALPDALLFLDHRRDVGQQLLRVVDDAVLDRVFDAADPLRLRPSGRSGAARRCRRAPSGSSAGSDRRRPGRRAGRRGRRRGRSACPPASASVTAPGCRWPPGSLRADGSRPPAAAPSRGCCRSRRCCR